MQKLDYSGKGNLADYPKVSYKEALERGLTHYWPDKKCGKGHMAFRYSSNKKCAMCIRNDSAKFYQKKSDPEGLARHTARVEAERIRNEIELQRQLKEVWE